MSSVPEANDSDDASSVGVGGDDSFSFDSTSSDSSFVDVDCDSVISFGALGASPKIAIASNVSLNSNGVASLPPIPPRTAAAGRGAGAGVADDGKKSDCGGALVVSNVMSNIDLCPGSGAAAACKFAVSLALPLLPPETTDTVAPSVLCETLICGATSTAFGCGWEGADSS